MKIVVNACHGGFSLSEEAYNYLGIPWDGHGALEDTGIARNDPRLVECVEMLGEKADGAFAQLEIVEVPDDVNWEIDNYDGMETIHEKHRRW